MFNRTAQTPEVMIFSDCIALMLASMAVWGVARPTVERKGFLPIATTRDNRLFIGLLATTYINLAWVGLTSEETSTWGGFIVSMVVLTTVMWRG